MCRLLGYVAREPVAAAQLLGDTLTGLMQVSHRHGDGWGLAWYEEDGRLELAKASEPAYASAEFASLAATLSTDALIGHVRWATPGYTPCLENTHPFTHDTLAFAHNGAIIPKEVLETLIAPHLRDSLQGTTDSERYFLALLSAFEKASPLEALQMLLGTLHQQLQSTSLNCLLLTPEMLYAVCDFDPKAPLAQKQPDYFHIQYQITQDAVLVGSTGLHQGPGWKTLRNGQILLAERGTLKVTIVDIVQNPRKSLQEQHLSQLQR